MKTSEISSLEHPLVKHLVKLRTDREYRYEQKSLLITGLKLMQEMVTDSTFKVIFIEKDFLLPPIFSKGCVIYRVSFAILKKISGLENPEPLLAEVDMPAFVEGGQKNFLLVLDGISDPGNMGTLIRSALALNWAGVFIAPHCTDPFNDKALRAAKGATFRISLSSGSWEDLKRILSKNKMHAYLADIGGTAFTEVKFQLPMALILSNESCGASDAAKEISLPISIPIHANMESLNVAAAGAILMYTLRQTR